MNNNSFGFDQQMVMGFDRTTVPSPGTPRRQTRQQRAAWWFSQMRIAVERAWAAEPQPVRPEQTYLSLPGKMPTK